MTCSGWTVELVECARHQTEPNRKLRAHLALCADCSERWDREQRLTAQFRAMRMRAALRSPNSRCESLMQDFSRMHRRPAVQTWAWALCAAAAVLLAVFLGQAFLGSTAGKRTSKPLPPAVRIHDESALYETSADASALSSDDFIAVPYTPPLAPGEMVRVVHADLYPEALASMGVEVDPSWAGDLPTDVVVGEDGLPRAVRITENAQF
jgi:hypothetical protein